MIKWHSACPFCNSRKRHRGLKILYERLLVSLDKPKIIHFAPEPVYYPIFKNKKYIYKTTDFFLEDVDYPHEDIQNLSIKDGMFDLALCNHVLEHVKNDKQAIKEVVRILDTGGQAIFTIPGNWRRKKTIKLPDLSYNGHYRDYGLEIIKVFEELFQSVEVLDLYEFNNYYKLPMGLTKKEDLAFICKK